LKKGFISLEYILIFGALLVVFSIFLLTIDGLYSKNLSAIDTRNLNKLKTTIQDTVSFQELQTISLRKIEINPKDCWYLKKISNQQISLENKTTKHNIYTRKTFNIDDYEICSKKQLTIETKNDYIYLYTD